jgi:hypothetical protein
MVARVSLAGCILAVLMVGCANLPDGTPVSHYDVHGPAVIGKATIDGDYALYRMTDINPILTVPVKEGQPIGFAAGTTGHIIALAGDTETTLPDDSYIWKRR